jgi:uncharacterized membrane protein (DUF2068 family)
MYTCESWTVCGHICAYGYAFLWEVSAGLWLPFVVFALAHGLATLSVVVLGMETKGKVLEEITE